MGCLTTPPAIPDAIVEAQLLATQVTAISVETAYAGDQKVYIQYASGPS